MGGGGIGRIGMQQSDLQQLIAQQAVDPRTGCSISAMALFNGTLSVEPDTAPEELSIFSKRKRKFREDVK